MNSRTLLIAGAVLVFGIVNWKIVAKERLRSSGQPMYLELVPVDPRSLMQGDYMALNFRLTRDIGSVVSRDNPGEHVAIVRLDDHHIGTFVRLDNGEPLAPGEMRFRFRVRTQDIWLGTNAFFFHEGDSNYYRNARYGEFRVDDDGNAMLVNLHDAFP